MENNKFVNRYTLSKEIINEYVTRKLFASTFFLCVEGFLLIMLIYDVVYAFIKPETGVKELIISAAYMLGIVIIRYFQKNSFVKKYIEEKKLNEAMPSLSFEFRRTQIVTKSTESDKTGAVPYADFKKFIKTKNLFIIETLDKNAIILKRDSFELGDAVVFESFLKEIIKRNKTK